MVTSPLGMLVTWRNRAARSCRRHPRRPVARFEDAIRKMVPEPDHRPSGATGRPPDVDTCDVGGVAALPPVATNAIAAIAG